MVKVTLNNIGTGTAFQTAIPTINANNDTLETAFDNTLSRDGTSPNTMLSNLDMNSYAILNLPMATDPTSPVRLQEVGDTPVMPPLQPHLLPQPLLQPLRHQLLQAPRLLKLVSQLPKRVTQLLLLLTPRLLRRLRQLMRLSLKVMNIHSLLLPLWQTPVQVCCVSITPLRPLPQPLPSVR